MKFVRLFAACTIPFLLSTPISAQLGSDFFSTMTPRNIGPAGMSGRVSDVEVVLRDPRVIYVGSAAGGVWKSVDGGLTWSGIFDNEQASSIGAVSVFQANPDVVWVGSGEGNPRNSAGVGRGIFKSVDGGQTWTHLGLERSERIHRILTHPTNQDIAYVAAIGPTWSDGDQRGVYKTIDGGQTWDRVLFTNQRSGAAELVMDPSNPNKLLAAMWEHRRWPWFFESGGEGSGLYLTHDGGETWTQLTEAHGLPDRPWGRMGLAIAPNNTNVMYALVEARTSALLRSDDGGQSWQTIDEGPGVAPRPFYYADIRVDPTNENRLYNLHSSITVSEDQGRNFRTVVPSSRIHGDVHELWIHPQDGNRLIMGNDGGIAFSYDMGRTWRFVENLPLAQFYHINVDMDIPFNVYGGLQDNGSWFGPSHSWIDGPIRNSYWTRSGGGDGFASLADFSNGRYGYSMSQGGNLRRFDRITGERKDIRPTSTDGTTLRFNWNAALNVDPHDSTVIYLGSQFVHRTSDGGNSWATISPDLTTNNPEKQRFAESGGLTRDGSGAEGHTTIVTIAPSPVASGVLWVGTDDGNVQLTRDGGATWTNTATNISGVPEGTWVPHIEPSKFRVEAAYAVYEDHRRGNWTSFIYHTEDYGRTWTNVATNGIDGFVHVVEQDPITPNLLFAGTEFGLFVSTDGGTQWWKWADNFPTVPVRDLLIHPRDHDLVIGTHGRAAWIIDDIRPLRELAAQPNLADATVHLFTPPAAYQHTVAESMTRGYRSTGDAMFGGDNRDYGAVISYVATSSDSTVITVTDSQGKTVQTWRRPPARGLVRLTWDFAREAIRTPGLTRNGTTSGPEVLPGSYRIEARSGNATSTTTLEVLWDPRQPLASADRLAKEEALQAVMTHFTTTADLMDRVRAAQQRVDSARTTLLGMDGNLQATIEAANTLRNSLAAVANRIAGPNNNDPTPVSTRLGRVGNSMQSSWDRPTEAQQRELQEISRVIEAVIRDANQLLSTDFPAFRTRAVAAGVRVAPLTGR